MDAKRIGVFITSLRPSTIQEGLKQAADLGLFATQLNYIAAVEDEWPAIRDRAEELGVDIIATNATADIVSDDSWREQRAVFRKTMEMMAPFPHPIVMTETGLSPFTPRAVEAEVWPKLVANCKELVKCAKDTGAILAFEMGGGLVQTSHDVIRLIDDVGLPELMVNLDGANTLMAGDDPVAAARVLSDRIVHVHAKDAVSSLEGTLDDFVSSHKPDELMAMYMRDDLPVREAPLGKGDTRFPEIYRVLEEAGYSGYYTIERETGDDYVADIAAARDFMQAI